MGGSPCVPSAWRLLIHTQTSMHMHMLPRVILLQLAAVASGLHAVPRGVSVRSRTVSTVRVNMAAKLISAAEVAGRKRGLPPGLADRTSFQTSTIKQADQDEKIAILWKEFKKCYPNEKAATEAVFKNAAVVLPQINSPTKIKGTFALLNKRLGKKVALEVITKNPGVLCCTPLSLEKQSDKDIIGAADLVEKIEENKGAIQVVAGLFIFSVPTAIFYKIALINAGLATAL